jgi:hypothetical protein
MNHSNPGFIIDTDWGFYNRVLYLLDLVKGTTVSERLLSSLWQKPNRLLPFPGMRKERSKRTSIGGIALSCDFESSFGLGKQ